MHLQIQTEDPRNIHVIETVTPTTSSEPTKLISIAPGCKIIKTYLTVRCAGLLEVPQYDRMGPTAPIKFLYRTARDFLYNNAIWNELLGKAKDTAFNPNKAGLIGLVLELAFDSSSNSPAKHEVYSKVANSLLFAHRIQSGDVFGPGDNRALDKLDSIMSNRSSKRDRRGDHRHWASELIGNSPRIKDGFVYLGLCVLYSLSRYVDNKLKMMHIQESAKIASKLLHTMLPSENWPEGVYFPRSEPDMVSTLFRNGADPNYCRGKLSHSHGPWLSILRRTSNSKYSEGAVSPIPAGDLAIMKLFLEAGATPSCGEYSATFVVRQHLLPYFGKEATELLDLIVNQQENVENSDSEESLEPKRKRRKGVYMNT